MSFSIRKGALALALGATCLAGPAGRNQKL